MSNFLGSSLEYKAKVLSWLTSQQDAAAAVWQQSAFPTRKTEDWKYTNLTSFAKNDFYGRAAPVIDHVDELSAHARIDGLVGSRLVFVNGHYSESLSVVEEQEGVRVVRFADANAGQQEKIQSQLNSCIDLEKHTFAALNTKSIDDGVFIDVASNALISKPIHVVHISTSNEDVFSVNTRLLVSLDASSSVTVIEHFCSDAIHQSVLNNAVTEFIVADNAELNFYRIMEESEKVNHLSGVHTRLGRSSRLNSFYLALGTQLTRVDVSVQYDGEGAEAEINGVYLPKNAQHVDFHTCIEHAVPHCTSNEVFRGIISDEARAVFNGRIHIHPDAQKTEAYLSNKNLLTSNKAEVDTKPELEIYADDVRCAHGATVAQLDDTAMHYLKTRGVSAEDAQIMLSFGFINELLEGLKLEEVASYCRPKLTSRFSRGTSLTEHM